VATTPPRPPRRTSELLGAAFALCRAHWSPLVVATVAAVAPLHALAASAALLVDPDTLDFQSASTKQFEHIHSGQLVLGIVSAVGVVLATGACVKTVADASAGVAPAAGRSLAFALQRLPALLAQYLVIVCAVTVSLFAFVLPAVWLLVVWSLAIPALLLDGSGPLRSLGSSFMLVRGRWWATFGAVVALVAVVIVALVVATNVVAIALGTPAGGARSALVFALASTLALALALPYAAAVLTLLDEERRGPLEAAPGGWLPPQPPPDSQRV
jgi:hypothetical protein